jgi:hypothetical protein
MWGYGNKILEENKILKVYSVCLTSVFWRRNCNLYEFYFPCQTRQHTRQLAHISLCITEFIGRTVSLHVSANGAIIRRYINKPYNIELCLSYGSIYCTNHCVTMNRKIWRASFPFVNHLYMHRLSGCVLYCFKNILNKYSNLIGSLKILKIYIKILIG